MLRRLDDSANLLLSDDLACIDRKTLQQTCSHSTFSETLELFFTIFDVVLNRTKSDVTP